MSLRPLGNNFLFEFLNETAQGRFIEKSGSGILLTNQDYELQAKYARWGRVLAAGDQVTAFKEGDLVLICFGKWTTTITFDSQKFWRSDETQVIATGSDESLANTF